MSLYTFPDVVNSLAEVPEQWRPFYAEQDGKAVLRGDDPIVKLSAATIAGAGRALDASRREVDAAKKLIPDLSPLTEFGSSPQEIAEKVRLEIEALRKKSSDPEAVTKLKEAMSTAHSKEIATYKTQLETLQKQLHTELVTSKATQAIAQAKGVPALVLPFISQQVQVQEVDGRLVPVVLGTDTRPRYSSVVPGALMTIDELVMEMKSDKQYGRLFDSEAPSGGGTNPQRQAPPTTTGTRSPVSKIAAGLSRKR